MILPPATLPAVGVFAVAARHENFARAAEELGLTASAVSHHVRTLESALGVRLFRRHARGAHLTSEGRQLADCASAALADIDATAGALKKARHNVTRLRVATLHSLSYCWILPRLKRFTAAHPRIRVTFETGLALARFDSAGPDLAIRHGEGYWPGLTAHHLMDEQLFAAAAPDLPGVRELIDAAEADAARADAARADAVRADAAKIAAAKIATLPLVTDLSYQGWPDWFRAVGMRGVSLPEMHIFNDSTDALRAAASGLGAVLARSRLATPYLNRGELVRLPGAPLQARFGYYAVHPTHRRPSTAAAALIQWLRQEGVADTFRY
jgi:LysR family transcriptional regulator, glycine cleavage system transcriptional activator